MKITHDAGKYVLYKEKTVIGMAALEDGRLWVEIAPAWRQRGYGSYLVKEILQQNGGYDVKRETRFTAGPAADEAAGALLKKPKVLILDDSTSAVDTRTDSQIRKAFREEIPNTTKLIISQRISSIEDADRIIVLNEGRIEGIGTHAELLANNAIYQEVYETQKKGEDEHEQA